MPIRKRNTYYDNDSSRYFLILWHLNNVVKFPALTIKKHITSLAVMWYLEWGYYSTLLITVAKLIIRCFLRDIRCP